MKDHEATLTGDQPSSDVELHTGRKRRLFGCITVIAGLVFGLIFVEIGLRVAGYSSPEFYMADNVRGYSLIPDMTGWYKKEGRNFVAINRDGFRDIEHSLRKPEGTVRIAVIGDSYVEAFQVSRVEMFTNFVSDEIERCGGMDGKKVEILNFGVSGYGTAQELLVLREKVWKYSPDFVMLVMTTNNDITDNSRIFRKTPIPYFIYRDNALVLDDGFRNEKTFMFRNSALGKTGIWFKNHLRVIQLIGEIQTGLKYRYEAWKNKNNAKSSVARAGELPPPATEVGIDSQVYREPSDENWKDAWHVTEGIIDLFKTETDEKGARLVVVTASNGVQVLPNVDQREGFARLLGVEDLFYPDRRIADFCTKNDIPVISLAPILADYAAREKVNLHGFEGNIGYGHWNQLGHRVAGETVGKQLCGGVLR